VSVDTSLIGWPGPDEGPLAAAFAGGPIGPEWDQAAAAIRLAEQEIGRLWQASISGEHSTDLQRLAEVSHALSRASRLLGEPGTMA
jgi:hypothetical protein